MSLCHCHTVLRTVSLELSFEIRTYVISVFVLLFFKIVLGIRGFPEIPHDLRMDFPISEKKKKDHWEFDRNYTESTGHFW